MDLIDIYASMQRSEITVEEAAKLFDMPVRTMKYRITRWGHRLPLLLSILDKIRRDEIGRTEAAEALQISVREVNHLMSTWKITRPIKPYIVVRAATGIKWELRKKFAIDYIAGAITLESAAEQAHCSDRQMRRWVSDLLKQHFDMPWKDLKHVNGRRRARLAQEIESAENLQHAKQAVLQSIADGKRALKDVALEQVQAKKERLRRHV